jgi:hypothetical protein
MSPKKPPTPRAFLKRLTGMGVRVVELGALRPHDNSRGFSVVLHSRLTQGNLFPTMDHLSARGAAIRISSGEGGHFRIYAEGERGLIEAAHRFLQQQM